MALKKGKTEHAGDKGSGRKDGYWGTRAEAKESSRKARRAADKKATKDTESATGAFGREPVGRP